MDRKAAVSSDIFNQSVLDSDFFIENYCGVNYIWKIKCIDKENFVEIKEQLDTTTFDFILNIFLQKRADTKKVKSLSIKYLKSMKKILKNISIDITKEKFVNKIASKFNNFHSKLQEIQREQAQSFLKKIKNKIYFIQNAGWNNKELDKQDEIFIEAILIIKDFTEMKFFKQFCNIFKDFMPEYNKNAEETIKGVIKEFIAEYDKKIVLKKNEAYNKMTAYIKKRFKRVIPFKFELLISEINENQENNIKWTILHEGYLQKEKISLSI